MIRYQGLEKGCVDPRWRGSVGSLFSYVDLEARVPRGHPLRAIRMAVNEALLQFDDDSALYAPIGRPKCPGGNGMSLKT